MGALESEANISASFYRILTTKDPSSLFGNVAVLMVHSVLYSSIYPQSLNLFKSTERIRLNDALEGAY